MSALNQNLINMYAAATAAGQSPMYHVSPLLTTAINHVAQTGQLPGLDPSSPWECLAMLDNIGIQLNPFNPAKVCVVNTTEWDSLSDEQRLLIFRVFEEIIREPCLMVGDTNVPERNFIGPLQCFEGAGTVSVGVNAMYPDFHLAAGKRWADFVIKIRLMHADPAMARRALDEALATGEIPKKVPRPPNPFIIYRSERHPVVAAANPGMPNKQISKILGQQWQNEDDHVRARYKAKADQIKEEFMRMHPGYKYTPRKSSEVKRRSKRTASTTQATVDTTDASEVSTQDEHDTQTLSDASGSSAADTED